MSSIAREISGLFSQKDLQLAVTLRDRAGDFVKIWEREHRERVHKWEPPRLSFGGAFASALDPYKAILESNKSQEQITINFADPVNRIENRQKRQINYPAPEEELRYLLRLIFQARA